MGAIRLGEEQPLSGFNRNANDFPEIFQIQISVVRKASLKQQDYIPIFSTKAPQASHRQGPRLRGTAPHACGAAGDIRLRAIGLARAMTMSGLKVPSHNLLRVSQ